MRPPTPPPFQEPLFDENDPRGWFWDEDGGGHVLDFGQYKDDGKKLHDTSLNYLRFCRANCPGRRAFINAFDKYYQGLETISNTEYDRFKVPFGRKHRGKMIRECRDKHWLLWARTQSMLMDKHPLFFLAVQKWLDDPRHYNVTRDIGDLCLRPSEYDDDLASDVERAKEGYVLPEIVEETQEEKDFIASEGSVEAIEEDTLDRLDKLVNRAARKAKKEKRNTGAERNGSPSKVKESMSGAPESSLKTAFSNVKNSRPIKSSLKATKPSARRNRKKLDVGDFVEEELSDGSESYVSSDHVSDVPAPNVPLTRAQAKVAAAAKKFLSEASSSRSRKRDASGGPSLKPPAKRAKRQIIPSETCSEESEERESPVESLKPPAKRAKLQMVPSETCSEKSEERESPMESLKPPAKRAKRQIVPSETRSEKSEERESPVESLKPPAKRAKRQIVSSETCSEKSEERESPMASLKPPAKRAKRSMVCSDTPFEPSEAELSMRHKTSTKRAKTPVILSEASSQEPEMNAPGRPKRLIAANMKAKSKPRR